MTNEFGEEVPEKVARAAEEMRCAGGARYVYRKGEYHGKKPAAAIGITRGSRFRSDSYASQEVELADGWIAFRSPGMSPTDVETVVLAVEDIPPLPSPRIGQETDTRRIDGSRLHFVVRDGVCLQAPSNPFKAFLVQKIQIDDGEGLENGHFPKSASPITWWLTKRAVAGSGYSANSPR